MSETFLNNPAWSIDAGAPSCRALLFAANGGAGAINAATLRQRLEEVGFETRVGFVPSSADVRREVSSFAPDVILVETMSAETAQPALDLARTLRGEAETFSTPLALVYHKDSKHLRESALKVGFDDYFSATATAQELRARIDAMRWRVEAGRRIAAPAVGEQRAEIDNFLLLLDAVRDDISRMTTGSLALVETLAFARKSASVEPRAAHHSLQRPLAAVHGFFKLNLRRLDAVGFYGPTTLLVYMPRRSARQASAALASLREEFLQTHAQLGCDLAIGLASFPDNGRDVETVIAHAEAALNLAHKQNEGARVVAYGASTPAPVVAETQASQPSSDSKVSDAKANVQKETPKSSSTPDASAKTPDTALTKTVEPPDAKTIEPTSTEPIANSAVIESTSTAAGEKSESAAAPPAQKSASASASSQTETRRASSVVQSGETSETAIELSLNDDVLALDEPAADSETAASVEMQTPSHQLSSAHELSSAPESPPAHQSAKASDTPPPENLQTASRFAAPLSESKRVRPLEGETQIGHAIFSGARESETAHGRIETHGAKVSARAETAAAGDKVGAPNVPAATPNAQTFNPQTRAQNSDSSRQTSPSKPAVEATHLENRSDANQQSRSVANPVRSGVVSNRAGGSIVWANPSLRERARTMHDARTPRRALLIVSNSARLTQLNLLMRSGGIEARAAFDGMQGASLVRLERPDVILIDYELSGMNGLETLKHLQRQSGGRLKLPVLFLLPASQNSVVSAQLRDAALQLGAQAIVGANPDPVELLEAVRALGAK